MCPNRINCKLTDYGQNTTNCPVLEGNLSCVAICSRKLPAPLLEQPRRLEDFVIILHFGCISEIHIATRKGSCQDWADLVGVLALIILPNPSLITEPLKTADMISMAQAPLVWGDREMGTVISSQTTP